MLQLRILDGPGAGAAPVAVMQGEQMKIGRDGPAQLLIEDERISSPHCSIEFGRHFWMLTDRSRHGTTVNGVRTKTPIPVGHESVIDAGPSRILVETFETRGGTRHPTPLSCSGNCDETFERAGRQVPGSWSDDLGYVLCVEDMEWLQKEAPPFERYLLIRHLGQGGQATVYKAEYQAPDPRENRLVALKILPFTGEMAAADPTELRMMKSLFLNEILAHLAVDACPYVLDVFDHGWEPEKGIYMAIELIEGRSLERYIESYGALPVEFACDVADQALRGLQYVHQRKFVHRDVKPGNILMEQAGGGRIAKLADLGLAKSYELAGLALDAAAVPAGFTPAFASPEHFGSVVRVGPSADVYSFGATLYYTLCALPIFDIEGSDRFDPGVWERYHRLEPPVPLRRRDPDFPDWLEEIVMHCLNKRPEERYADAFEVAQALRRGRGLPRIADRAAWMMEPPAPCRPS